MTFYRALPLLTAPLLLLFFAKESRKPTAIVWARANIRHSFWKNQPQCSHFETRFARKGSLPTRALVSYPGSGNTWIRYLVEGATGVYTGSVFHDHRIQREGHHGEFRAPQDGSTILQKSHHNSLVMQPKVVQTLLWRKRHINFFGGRAVVIVRNPYRAIISYWNHQKGGGHTGLAPKTSFMGSSFADFALKGADKWLMLISDWLKLGKQVHFLFYEEVKADPVGQVRSLLAHLNLAVDEERLSCIASSHRETFHRVLDHQQEVKPFEERPELGRKVEEVVRKAKQLLEDAGWHLPCRLYPEFPGQKTLTIKI